MEQRTTIKKEFDPKSLIWPLVILLIVAGIIWGIYNYTTREQVAEVPTVEITTPADGGTVDANTIQVQGKTNSKNTVTVNGSDVEVASDGSFTSDVALVEGENKITITAYAAGGEKIDKTISVVRESQVTASENPVAGAGSDLSDSGPESLWIPEASLLALAGASYYGTRKKIKTRN